MLIYRQKITKDSICKSHVTGSLEYSVYFLAKKANKTITVWFSSRMSNLSTLILFLMRYGQTSPGQRATLWRGYNRIPDTHSNFQKTPAGGP